MFTIQFAYKLFHNVYDLQKLLSRLPLLLFSQLTWFSKTFPTAY